MQGVFCGVGMGSLPLRGYGLPKRFRGQKRSEASPIRFPLGTGPKYRESWELARLSPMTKTWSSGTNMGPKVLTPGGALAPAATK